MPTNGADTGSGRPRFHRVDLAEPAAFDAVFDSDGC
jgi:hypothetical protein